MAIGRVTRQAVEALPSRQRRSQPAQTVDTFVQQQPDIQESSASRVVRGLFEFTGKAMDVAVRAEKSKIELDKVTQQQRALQGLAPTDDATNAGVRAYQLINVRDDVLQANSDLAQKIREQPDMDDEQFEVLTRETYAPLLSQYQGDAQLSQALSAKLQESQTQIFQIKEAAQREHRDWQRQETFKTSIEEYREAAASTQELAEMINGGQLYNEADALGITEQQFRTGLINMAAMDADQGDGRILAALEGQEWASTDERIGKAREVYQQWEAQNNAVEIGTQWGEIQQAWKNRTASWGQTAEAIRRINDRFPGSISAGQVASLRQAAAAQHNRDSNNAAALQSFWQSQRGDRPVRLGTNPLIPDNQRDYIIGKTSEQMETFARGKQASGDWTPEQAEAWVLSEKLKFGRQQGIEMPGISDVISSLANEDPSDWGGEGIPTYFLPALQSIPMMNESDIERYGATERERNMMRTYKRFLSGDQPDRDAWRRSYRAITSESTLTPEQRSTVVDRAYEVVDDEVERRFWQSGKDMPEPLRNYLRSNAQLEAMALTGTGGLDPGTAGQVGAERAYNRITQLNSGTFVTRNSDSIIRDSAFRDPEGKDYLLSEGDVSPAFESFFQENLDSLAIESYHGTDLSIENVYFDARPNGLVMVMDDMGEPLLDAPVSLQDIAKRYIDMTAEERAASSVGRARGEAERSSRYMDQLNQMQSP